MASLLDILSPGQPWLPGGPVNAAGLEKGRQYLNNLSFYQRPSVDYSSPRFNPFAPVQTVPRTGFDAMGRPLAPAGGATGAGPDGTGGTPFSAETLVRNPELAAILKKLYGEIGTLSTDPNVNQTVLQRNVKLPEVEKAGQAALQRSEADATNNAQSIRDFAKAFMGGQAGAEAATAEETGAIGKLYSGEYAKALEENRRQAGILSTQNLARRLSALGGSGNLGDLARGGVTNSMANANLMREGANASLARDMEFAKQRRDDIQNIMAQQLAAAGVRNRLTDATLSRSLVPLQAGQAVAGADASRLGALASILGQNNVFTPQTHAGLTGNMIDLFRNAAGLDPAAYYRYVKGQFPNNLDSGVVPQQPLRLPSPGAPGTGGPGLMDLLNALSGGGVERGTGGPARGPNLPAASAYTGMNRNPFKYGPPDQTQMLRDQIFQDYTTGDNSSNSPDSIMKWLYSLTPEQLGTIPAGGFE